MAVGNEVDSARERRRAAPLVVHRLAPGGAAVELVAVELMGGWLIIHANTPVQKKFSAEIDRTERRAR